MNPKLTATENEILCDICVGLMSKEIADRRGVSVRTVETHRERIYRKLEIKNRNVVSLYNRAIELGLVQAPSNKIPNLERLKQPVADFMKAWERILEATT